jgi:hypothetical protein
MQEKTGLSRWLYDGFTVFRACLHYLGSDNGGLEVGRGDSWKFHFRSTGRVENSAIN